LSSSTSCSLLVGTKGPFDVVGGLVIVGGISGIWFWLFDQRFFSLMIGVSSLILGLYGVIIAFVDIGPEHTTGMMVALIASGILTLMKAHQIANTY
jgi:hypothetical protein